MFTSKKDRVFEGFINLTLIIVLITALYPLYYTVIASISDPLMVTGGRVWLFPRNITMDSYKNVFANKEIWTGYSNTIIYTVLATSLDLAVTITCAYALSKKRLAGKNMIMGIFVFTMYFNGGLIPNYILIKSLGWVDTLWVMIIPGALSVYNMIITRTFYQNNVPDELYEAARIDGSTEIGMFFRILIPLSAPIIAVMALFYGVGHWNQFFNAMIYLNDHKLFPLQLILRNILLMNQQMVMDNMTTEQMDSIARRAQLAETMKYALIFISSFPVLVIYPFMQKYFVKGVMIGAIKG